MSWMSPFYKHPSCPARRKWNRFCILHAWCVHTCARVWRREKWGSAPGASQCAYPSQIHSVRLPWQLLSCTRRMLMHTDSPSFPLSLSRLLALSLCTVLLLFLSLLLCVASLSSFSASMSLSIQFPPLPYLPTRMPWDSLYGALQCF